MTDRSIVEDFIQIMDNLLALSLGAAGKSEPTKGHVKATRGRVLELIFCAHSSHLIEIELYNIEAALVAQRNARPPSGIGLTRQTVRAVGVAGMREIPRREIAINMGGTAPDASEEMSGLFSTFCVLKRS